MTPAKSGHGSNQYCTYGFDRGPSERVGGHWKTFFFIKQIVFVDVMYCTYAQKGFVSYGLKMTWTGLDWRMRKTFR